MPYASSQIGPTHDECSEVVKIAICILAKNEAKCIANILGQLASQSLFANGQQDIAVHVVANGCTDDTVEIALSQVALLKSERATMHVHDIHRGGKSRSWNTAVHELVDPSVDFFIFVDADITFIDDQVLGLLLTRL